jgi:uncharacterized protein (DUF2225 family)
MKKSLTPEELRVRNERIKELQPKEKTPFIFVPATCPICGKESVQKYIKNNVYTIGNRALDMRQTEYRFTDSDFSHIYPLMYFIWQCPHCKFTSDWEVFENPVEDVISTLHNFRKRWLENYKTSEKFRNVLVALLNEEQNDNHFFNAVKLYLMAIFQFSSINSIVERDALIIAKLTLRLSWLLQDLEESPQAASTKYLVDQLKFSVIFNWENAPFTIEEAHQLALTFYDTTYFASNIISEKMIEHNILQVIGRLNIILGNVKEGRDTLMKAILAVNKYKSILEKKIRSANTSKDEQDNLRGKIVLFDNFVQETQELLYEAKNLANKES